MRSAPLLLLLAGVPSALGQEPRLVVEVGHKGSVDALTFSSDGTLLVSGSADGFGNGEVKVWNVRTGLELRTIAASGHAITCLALDPAGRTIATGGRENTIRFWDLNTGGEVGRSLAGHSNRIEAVAFIANGTRLASIGSDKTVRLWDVVTRQPRGTLTDASGWLPTIAFRPGGQTVVLATGDGRVKTWDLRTGAKGSLSKAGVGNETVPAAFNRDGSLLATVEGAEAAEDIDTGERASPLIVWAAATGRKHWAAAPSPTDLAIGHPVFSEDGRLLATAGPDSTATLWDVATGKPPRTFGMKGESDVTSLGFSPDSKALALGRRDGTLDLWSVSSGERLERLGRPARTVAGLTFSRDARRLAYGSVDRPTDSGPGEGARDRSVRLWDLVRGRPVRVGAGDVLLAQFSPDSARLATGNRDGGITLWDLAGTKTPVAFSRAHSDSISSLSFAPDGHVLASGGWDGTIRLWEADTGKLLRTLGGDARWVPSLDFSPDGRMLVGAVGGDRREDALRSAIAFWDVRTGEELRRLTGPWEQVYSVRFSPDGTLLASASMDGSVRLWKAATGELWRTFGDQGKAASIQSIAFNSAGTVLASGDAAGTVQLWEVSTGAKVLPPFSGQSGIVSDVVFYPGGKILASSIDNTIHLWETDTGKEVASLIALENGDIKDRGELDLEWVVITPEGLFDASPGGMDHLLHWVVGKEPIAVSQLKERYYEPGLLAKVVGLNPEPLRDVHAFAAPTLYPDIQLREPDPDRHVLGIRLTNRGGGIGRVIVSLNGKEATADARRPNSDHSARVLELEVPLTDHPYLLPGKNLIQVRAYNAEGYLVSRGVEVVYQMPVVAAPQKPHLWAIVAGVSDYDGEGLDLRYAAKDAVDMARALKLGAERLFGADHVHLSLLTTEPAAGALPPTKQNLVDAFKAAARQAVSNDVLVVYLAGHGVTHGGAEGDFYYLTRAAGSGDLTDPAVRTAAALSSMELTDLSREVPALKQVLILDTCGAGRALERLTAPRDVPSSQIRALERLKDRTGVFVLAGSAADAVSYEASRYGQGLLTYSLLLGMRGAALREEQFVDVSLLFDDAVDRVPELARDIGGIQRPLKATPGATSMDFDIGQLNQEDKAAIPLARPRPLVLRASFQNQERLIDSLGLTRRVNDGLRALSARGLDAPLVFVDATEAPDAQTVTGRYRVAGTTIVVSAVLSEGDREVGAFSVQGDANNLEALVLRILSDVERRLARSP